MACLPKEADGLAQSEDRADEAHHGDSPDESLDEAIAGVDLLLVIGSLRL